LVTVPDEVPFRQVNLAENTVGEEEVAAVTSVLRSGWLSAGPVTKEFESDFADLMHVPAAVAVSSGTAALHLALLALGLSPGDEVIVPSLSFVASAAITALHSGVPVFADVISENEPTIAPNEVLRLLGPRTRAVVVMHYGGYPARVAEIRALAAERGVPVIEDAAHAPAVRIDGGQLGTLGEIGCFSFYATKNLTTGEGGMVVARDPALLARVQTMRSHYITQTAWERAQGVGDYDIPGIGLNYRPTEMSSALGRIQLGRLPGDRSARTRLVRMYRDLLAGLPGLSVPFQDYAEDSAYHLMAVLLPTFASRDSVRRELRAVGVQTSVHYQPTHLLSYYRERRPATADPLPVCEGMADRLLSLPLHARMTDEDVNHVAAALRTAIGD
jgi:dTDP-4-amino-4,6-dideoxygalactose transaminase